VKDGTTRHRTQPHEHRLSCTADMHRERRRHGPDPQAVPQPTNRKLAGVCGGLAQYFNTDATLIRVLFVVLAVLGGAGLVIYLAMWIIVPNEP